MRSRLILITGCLLIALWAIGMGAFALLDSAENPLRLILLEGGLGRRLGNTTVVIVAAIVTTVFLVVFIAFVIRRAKTQLQKEQEEPVSVLEDIKERLREDYPKYSGREERRGRGERSDE